MWLWSWSFTTHCMYGDLPIYSWSLCFTLWLCDDPQSIALYENLTLNPRADGFGSTSCAVYFGSYPERLSCRCSDFSQVIEYICFCLRRLTYLYIIHAFSVYVGNCGCYGAVWMGCFYVQLMSHWLTEGQVWGLTRHKPVLNPQRCSCCWPFQGGDPFVNLLCVCTALLVPFCVTLFRYTSLFHVYCGLTGASDCFLAFLVWLCCFYGVRVWVRDAFCMALNCLARAP